MMRLTRSATEGRRRPAGIPAVVRAWQLQLLEGILRVTVILGLLLTVAGVFFAARAGDLYKIPLYLGLYGLVVVIALWGRIPYTVKAVFFMGLLYALTLLEFSEDGLSGSGRVYLLAVTALGVLLLGRRAALPTILLGAVIMAGFGWAFSAGVIAVSVESLATTLRPASWVTATISFVLMASMLVMSQNFLIPALTEMLITLEDRVDQRTEELRLAKRQAEEARDAAIAADQLKSRFLANMSHELRTPLNAILNFNEMMAMGLVDPVTERQVDLLNKSLDSGKHLLDLINDILDMTKIQSDKLTLFIEDDIDLNAMLTSVQVVAESLLEKTPTVTLITDIQPNLPSISGDRRRIRQVLLNLISNAAKFTEAGSITISASATDDKIRFTVTDTGPGIPPDQHQSIFEPFVQTDAGIKHQQGAGLGLPISQRLIELHGGHLWLESTPGEGAAFFVEIPLS